MDYFAQTYTCPKCKRHLKRHCAHCGWFVCVKDKATWVLTVVKNENQEPITLWSLAKDFFPMPLKPLPPLPS